jgi:hypothetical protein
MRPILRLTAAMLTLALAVQGCALFARHYPNPPLPLQPTTVGVIAETTQDASGYHAHLVDGRVIDLPQNGTFKLIGGGLEDKGTLLLAGTAGGGFETPLSSLGNGCWEAYVGPSSNPIVWDMGDSILFMTGIELSKAADYQVSPAPHLVDGRQAWTVPEGDGAPPMSFCANDRGEIEWGKPLQ